MRQQKEWPGSLGISLARRDESGEAIRRNAVIGTMDEYPSEELLKQRQWSETQYNDIRNRQRQQPIFSAELIDHYLTTELGEQPLNGALMPPVLVYREFLVRWIKPHWGSFKIRDVRTVAVESWLRQLQRQDGRSSSQFDEGKDTECSMSVLFNHAIRYEWLEQGKNPITLVRQSALRRFTPTVLETHEVQSLLSELAVPLSCNGAVGCHDRIATQRTVCLEVEGY